MHLYSSLGRSSSGYKPSSPAPLEPLDYLYPQYSHTRRKTEWAQPNHDYDILYGLNYTDRNELYLRLEEEKLYNRRSKLIIEDLLEEKKRREAQGDAAKVGKDFREKIINRYAGTKKAKKDKFQQPIYSPQTQKSKNSHSYQNLIKSPLQGKDEPGLGNKNKTKEQILKKLFNSEQPQKQKAPKIIETVYQKQMIDKDKVRLQTITNCSQENQIEIMREELNFLKQQLNQKNKAIIDYQCEIVRLQKSQKIKAEMLNGSMKRQKEEKERKPNLAMESKCFNIMAQVKKGRKHYSSGNKFEVCIQREAIPQLTKWEVPEENQKEPQRKAKVQAEIQTEKQEKLQISSRPQSEVKLRFSSSIAYSFEMGSKGSESEIDFNLSVSQMPIFSNKASQQQREPQIVEKIQEEQSAIEIHSEMVDQSWQTEANLGVNQESQTSENYYDYIEKTYLDWMFEKDYKQLQQKKSKIAQ